MFVIYSLMLKAVELFVALVLGSSINRVLSEASVPAHAISSKK
jgi:hypothetical protein